MNGNDAVVIAQQALRWAAADGSRKALLEQLHAARAADSGGLGDHSALERLQRSAAAKAAGLRRGLATKCMAVLLKGLAEPGVPR